MTSIGMRIPLVASIVFHTRREKELSIDEQAVRPRMRQNQKTDVLEQKSSQTAARTLKSKISMYLRNLQAGFAGIPQVTPVT